jgi:Phosphodiester glycosidase
LSRNGTLLVLAASVVIATLAVLVWWQRSSRWQFSILETSKLAAGIEYRHVRFANHRDSFEAFVVMFDPSAVRASVVDLGTDGTKLLQDVSSEQRAAVVINGGYFDDKRQPIGLHRIGGQTISPLVQRAPLSGFVCIDATGRLSITTATDPEGRGASDVIQAGPFLIDPGGRIGIHSDTAPPTERTVCAIADSKACLICTTPASLLNLSRCLNDVPEAFGLGQIDRALNLDGGPSTGFVIQTSDRHLIREPRGKIRDALMIQSK